jgi:hypothetical protein
MHVLWLLCPRQPVTTNHSPNHLLTVCIYSQLALPALHCQLVAVHSLMTAHLKDSPHDCALGTRLTTPTHHLHHHYQSASWRSANGYHSL